MNQDIEKLKSFFEQMGFSVEYSLTQNIHKLYKAFWFSRDVNVSLTRSTIKEIFAAPGKYLEKLNEKYLFSSMIKTLRVRDKERFNVWHEASLQELKINDQIEIEYWTSSFRDCWDGLDVTHLYSNTETKADHVQQCFNIGCYDDPKFKMLLSLRENWKYFKNVTFNKATIKNLQQISREHGEARILSCYPFYYWWKSNQPPPV